MPITTRVRSNQTSDTSQHALLKRLAENVENVYYIAPTFHTSEEFNEHFNQQSVTANSLWAPLNALPCVTDNDVHHLTFTEHCVSPSWHSEPLPLEGKFTAEEHYATTQEMVDIDESYFYQLRDKLIIALEASQLKVQQSWAPLNALPCVTDNDVHHLTGTRNPLFSTYLTKLLTC